jgi:hypothetical protein
MTPRSFINVVDSIKVYTNPKCSCRTVSDFIWEVNQKKQILFNEEINIIVFRNPYRRLVSGYLNKYVEHNKYMEESFLKNPKINIKTFEMFVNELDTNGLKYIDNLHFSPQIKKYKNIKFDYIFNSENLNPLNIFINNLFLTNEIMPVRVNKYGIKNSKNKDSKINYYDLKTEELLNIIKLKEPITYNKFYNDDLMNKVKNIYDEDFNFIEEWSSKNIIDKSFYNEIINLF